MPIANIQRCTLPANFHNHVAFDQDRSVWAHHGSNAITTVDWSSEEPQLQTFSWDVDGTRPRPCDLVPLGEDQWAIHTLTGHHNDGGYDLRRMAFHDLPDGAEIPAWRCSRFYSKLVGVEGRVLANIYEDGVISLVELTPEHTERTVYKTDKSRCTGFASIPLHNQRQGLLWGGDIFMWNDDGMMEVAWPLHAGPRCTFRRMGNPDAHQAAPDEDGTLYYLHNTYSRLQQGGEIFIASRGESGRKQPPFRLPRVEGLIALPDGALLGVEPKPKRYALIWFLDQKKCVSITAKALGVTDLCVGGVWWSEVSQSLYIQNNRSLLKIAWKDIQSARKQKMRS